MPDTDAAPRTSATGGRGAGPGRRWTAAAPALALLALVPLLGAPPLWRDEVMTQVAASKHLDALATMLLTRTDATSGLHYLLLWPLAQVTDGAWWWRLPSLVGVAVAVAVTGMTAQRSAGAGAGLLAGAVLLADAATWWAAGEARSYGLALGAAAVVVHLFLGVRRGGGHPALFTAAAVVCVHLQAVSGLLLAALAAVLAVPGLDLDRRRLLRACVVAALLCAPLAVLVVQQSGAQTSWVPLLRGVGRWTDLPRDLLGGGWGAGALAVVVAVGSATAVSGLRRSPAGAAAPASPARWSHPTATAVVVCLAAVVLTVLALTAASLVAHVFVPRYLLVVLPPLAVLVGTGLSRLGRSPRTAAVVLLVVLAASGWWRAGTGADKPDDPAAAARWVESRDAAGDVVVYDPGWLRSVVGTELERDGDRVVADPTVDPSLDPAGWPDLYLPERSPGAVGAALELAPRAWVVSKPGDGWDPTADSAATAWREATASPGEWQRVEQRSFGEVEVTLYRRAG